MGVGPPPQQGMVMGGPPGMPMSFQPSAPPPLAIPSPHPTYSHQQHTLPSPTGSGMGGAATPAAAPPPPTVYQHHQQQQQQQHPAGAQMYEGNTPGGMGMMGHGMGMGGMQPPAAPMPPPPPPAPTGPPANITIATADISAVPAELRPVSTSLINLYQACESFAGAHPGKRKELDDASKKLGALLWKLNKGEVSPGVAGKLQQMCGALDMGDFGSVGHLLVQMTTSDWDECDPWLTALKRLIKLRQTG